MATRNPRDSRTRESTAIAKDGWSTYASPVTKTTSGASQPRARISSAVVGSQGAGSGLTRPSYAWAGGAQGPAEPRYAGLEPMSQLPLFAIFRETELVDDERGRVT